MNTIVIKRYPNRKYWAKGYEKDTYLTPTAKRKYRRSYINLTEITNLLKEGMQIKVIEHQTGEDITKNVLRRIARINYSKRLSLEHNLLSLRYEALKDE